MFPMTPFFVSPHLKQLRAKICQTPSAVKDSNCFTDLVETIIHIEPVLVDTRPAQAHEVDRIQFKVEVPVLSSSVDDAKESSHGIATEPVSFKDGQQHLFHYRYKTLLLRHIFLGP